MARFAAGFDTRPDWEDYFLGIALAVSARGDCTRSQVGAVLVNRLGRIRGTGYNGARPGGPSCLRGECPRGLQSYDDVAPLSSYGETGPSSCVAIHAEMNVLLFSSDDDRVDGTLYITREPCDGCLRIVQGSGIKRIVWSASKSGPRGHWVQQADSEWLRFVRG